MDKTEQGALRAPAGGIARKTAVDASAEHLRRAILGGELGPGSRLPPERELAERFGINRMTLRAALARLSLEGLLAARQGSGHTVRDFRMSGGPQLVPALLEALGDGAQRERAVVELLAVRRAVARVVLEAAARRIDEAPTPPGGEGLRAEALVRLDLAIDRFESDARAGAGPDELALADAAIVEALMRATGSAVLPLFMNPMAQLVGALPELKATLYADPPGNVMGWRAVSTWLGLGPARRPAFDAIERLMAQRDRATVSRLFGDGVTR